MNAPTPIFTGRVDEAGRLRIDVRRVFDGYLRRLKGQAVEVVVRKRRKQRSLQANAYWWAVPVRIIAAETGEDPDRVHYALLAECWGHQESKVSGQMVPVKTSSRKLTTDEFSHLIEWVGPWAMENLGIQIPLPSECDYSGAA